MQRTPSTNPKACAGEHRPACTGSVLGRLVLGLCPPLVDRVRVENLHRGFAKNSVLIDGPAVSAGPTKKGAVPNAKSLGSTLGAVQKRDKLVVDRSAHVSALPSFAAAASTPIHRPSEDSQGHRWRKAAPAGRSPPRTQAVSVSTSHSTPIADGSPCPKPSRKPSEPYGPPSQRRIHAGMTLLPEAGSAGGAGGP